MISKLKRDRECAAQKTNFLSLNPVLAKANPCHPGTTKIFADAALEALEKAGLPRATVQLLYHLQREDGLRLVSHPFVGARAFTGNRQSGLRPKKAAEGAGKLIYLEMSGLNPVFILPAALEERLEEIAKELFISCTQGAGQFCTKPGLVILAKDKLAETFLLQVSEYFERAPAEVLLSQEVLRGIAAAVKEMKRNGAEIITGGKKSSGPGFRYANTLLRFSGKVFLRHPEALQVESFGTVTLFVFAKDMAETMEIASHLEGSLTGSIYSQSQSKEEIFYQQIEPILRRKVGRLLNNKMPTGVVVTVAMNHGDPFPATCHPGFTSIGIPASLIRFAALHCYDNVCQHRLPPELQDKNPTGQMWRSIDGEWTQRDVER